MDKHVRSRSSSSSHPLSSSSSRVYLNSCLSPEQLSRHRSDSSQDSSFPTTPAPTPLLQVSHHMHPELLAAGIKQLKVDEGYIESTSSPGTPAPSPFSPSPAQAPTLRPDQIAEGIQRLREEEGGALSGNSSGQPPTPATTPGLPPAPGHPVHIPERLLETLHCDEGLESGSNPATPVPTPTTGSLRGGQAVFPPEQLAAGITRLKAEEGMSSGGSSGFPSTPAPTPFSHLAGGVLPEDLAAGISRLSVIEEAETANATAAAAVVVVEMGSEERPSSLLTTSSNMSSLYATPTAPTPGGTTVIGCEASAEELWIPSPASASVLQSMAAESSYFPEKSSLTFTNLYCKEDRKEDPLKAMVSHFHGPEAARRSHIPNADTVTQDFEGLKHLIQSECYRAAVTLSGRLLTSMGQVLHEQNHVIKHTPTSLQIWFIRLSLLLKLNLINKAEAEAEPFQPDGDKPDLYYEFYASDFPGKRGPMISFGFRLLLAQIPQFHGKVHETLDRLYFLWNKIKKILNNIPGGGDDDKNTIKKNIWLLREIHVLYALVNSYLIQNDYVLAVETTMTLLEKERSENKAGVYSLLGRIYLQLGDVESSRKSFKSASDLRDPNKEADVVNNLMDASLLAMGNNGYSEALGILQQAREISNDPVIVNNMSVCLLPQGRLSESLSLLETSITNDPLHYQFEEPIRNLSTLYDLESSYVTQKRQRLLGLIAQYKGDGFNPSCIQLPT